MTEDHVKSISMGGTHTQDNVAYVHKLCNERKFQDDYTEMFQKKIGGDLNGCGEEQLC